MTQVCGAPILCGTTAQGQNKLLLCCFPSLKWPKVCMGGGQVIVGHDNTNPRSVVATAAGYFPIPVNLKFHQGVGCDQRRLVLGKTVKLQHPIRTSHLVCLLSSGSWQKN